MKQIDGRKHTPLCGDRAELPRTLRYELGSQLVYWVPLAPCGRLPCKPCMVCASTMKKGSNVAKLAPLALPHGRDSRHNVLDLHLHPPRRRRGTFGRCLSLRRAAERSRERVAAVAHVSSVTHRYASVASVHRFLRDWTEGSYANTKLANAQFARECQRRWGPGGVASSAVDPGAVYSSLWNNDAVFGSFPINRLLSFLYAPPTDAVESVVAAVVEPFAEARERERTKAGGFANAANDRRGGDDVGFRFYARGLFASYAVAFRGPGDARDATSRFARARWVARCALWGFATLACSLADWPLRRFTRGAVAGKVAEVPASEATYDEAIAEALWNEAGKAARAAGETTR